MPQVPGDRADRPPWLRSADAFTSFSHVSIAVGSFERSSDLAITSVDGAR
jgi:hypothetical protein